MRLTIKSSQVTGQVDAPPSKSYSHRALIIGSISQRPVTINNLLLSGDVKATIKGCQKLGAKISIKKKKKTNSVTLQLEKFTSKSQTIDAQKSGTTLRFLLGIASTLDVPIKLTGHQTLLNRPIGPLVNALRSLGAHIDELERPGYPPVQTEGGLGSGTLYLPELESSQYISALLIASVLVKGQSQINFSPPKSLPYIFLTAEILEYMGFKLIISRPHQNQLTFDINGNTSPVNAPVEYTVSGDWSNAAMILAAGAISGKVKVKGLVNDQQGDQEILKILRTMNATVHTNFHRQMLEVEVSAPNNELTGISCDCRDIPDLVPVIATLGAFAKGTTTIFGAEHLKLKESNRIDTLAREYAKLGVKIKPTSEGLIIKGPSIPNGSASSHGDHRLAMSLSLLGLKSDRGVSVNQTECIRDSYPQFVTHLNSLGANINEYNR